VWVLHGISGSLVRSMIRIHARVESGAPGTAGMPWAADCAKKGGVVRRGALNATRHRQQPIALGLWRAGLDAPRPKRQSLCGPRLVRQGACVGSASVVEGHSAPGAVDGHGRLFAKRRPSIERSGPTGVAVISTALRRSAELMTREKSRYRP